MKIQGVTIGADPEVFVLDDSGEIGSAIGRIGGSKENPIPLDGGGAIQEDNVLAEFNIDPATTAKGFIYNIKSVMNQLEEVVGPLVIKSSHEYLKSVLMEYGEQALTFGCDPDVCAWTGKTNQSPNPYTTLRTAGGHLHIGYEDHNEDLNISIAKMCDIFLGVPSVLMDNDGLRRKLYGYAGSMRHKPYGVEYRSLSNFWLRSDKYMDWAFNGCIRAATEVGSLNDYIKSAGGEGNIIKAINNNDASLASEICKELEIVYVPNAA